MQAPHVEKAKLYKVLREVVEEDQTGKSSTTSAPQPNDFIFLWKRNRNRIGTQSCTCQRVQDVVWIQDITYQFWIF